jgi:hypothetical protein
MEILTPQPPKGGVRFLHNFKPPLGGLGVKKNIEHKGITLKKLIFVDQYKFFS